MVRRIPLRCQELESRDVPATFGTPWPDGQQLSLSFAPDNTSIAGYSSDLSDLGSAAIMQMLTAFQTWAMQANLNVGLVADDGSRFGIGGPVQGDPRFGDIRIGGLPLLADVLAITAPYNLYDNYSGDVVVNTAAYGSSGPDLYTVILQEAGHALSVGNSSDPSSVMYEFYQGPRSGLAAGDVASIRGLYGARPADAFEGTTGNSTLSTATHYTAPVTADLTTTADVDVYRMTGALLASSATVTVHAQGLSLVTPRVEILDNYGNVLTSAAVTDPTNNDVTLSLNSVHYGAKYYVRISSARSDVFGVGAYQLTIQQRDLLGGLIGTVDGILDDTGLNDTLQSATNLLANSNTIDTTDEFSVDGNFGSASDVDDYHIVVPGTAGGSPVNLVATIWGADGAALSTWIDVYDAAGNKMNADVLTADGNTTTLQVHGLNPGSAYFLSLASDVHALGNYHLSVDLRTDAIAFPHGGTGTLTAAAPIAAAIFELPQTAQVHSVLTATGVSAAGRSAQFVILNVDGTVAAQFDTPVGRGRSLDVFLPAGSYRIEIRSSDPSVPIGFRLGLAVVTDPTGATPVDPTGTPEQPPPPPPPPPSDPPLVPDDPDPDDADWY